MHQVHEDLLGKLVSTHPKLLLLKGAVNGIILKKMQLNSLTLRDVQKQELFDNRVSYWLISHSQAASGSALSGETS